VKKTHSLEIARAKSALRPALTRYFKGRDKILTKHNLKVEPSRVYNIDKRGLN
jgi:hypothetical protein